MSELLDEYEAEDQQAWQRADELLDMRQQLEALWRLWTGNCTVQDARYIASRLGISDEFDKFINYKHGV